jgi:hypothetical protein
MPFGFPGATKISSLLRANVSGDSTNPASVSVFIDAASAVAITSAGAPCSIWVTRVPDPAKLYLTETPGSDVSMRVCRSVNDSVNDAAAKTVIEPVGFGAVDGELGAVFVDGSRSEPQAAKPSTKASIRHEAIGKRRDMSLLCALGNQRADSSRDVQPNAEEKLAEARVSGPTIGLLRS